MRELMAMIVLLEQVFISQAILNNALQAFGHNKITKE